MKRILSLSKVVLINSFETLTVSKRKKSKNKFNLIGLLFLYAIISISLYFSAKDIIKALLDLNVDLTSLIEMSLVVSFIYILFVTIMTTPSVYYFSKDVESFLSLPIKPFEIIIAKFVSVYTITLLSTSIFLIPFAIAYYLLIKPSILFLFFYLIAMISIIIIPLVIGILFIIVLFTFIPRVNNKDLFTYFSFFLSIVIILVLNFSSIINQNISMMTIFNNLQTFILKYIFMTKLIIDGTVYFNFIKLAFGLILSLLFSAVLLYLSTNLYFKGVVGNSEIRSKKASLVKFNENRKYSSQLFTLLKLDILNILRTPVFVMNYLLPIIIMPVFYLVPALTIFLGDNALFELSEIILTVNLFLQQFEAVDIFVFSFNISVVITLFLGSTSTISSTAISREGENIITYKYLPTNLLTLINAKLLLGIIVSMLIPTIILISFSLIFEYKLIYFIVSLITILLVSTLSNLIDIAVDVNFPKLIWDNETQAVKQNFVSIIPMLLSFALAGLLIFLFIYFIDNYVLFTIVIFVMIVVVSIFLYEIIIKKLGLKKLNKAIENV